MPFGKKSLTAIFYEIKSLSCQLIALLTLLVVDVLKAKEAANGNSRKEEEEGWELRAAPLGPDPLHHHGAGPIKPRSP
ncbi:hypothetical protein E3N88_41716 [Mikania micrantha]|uniref:Uncharacterized protein n=1 Tax=Mikania micrantha TaxID=192012 RepID=A0A5N6LKN5_9ASTR|nr:hypothetical protein E3N88_41718 [Mikania micrantha]KAD2158595.1 hypothetical protein E3N88_41716 [Mikania micrantha]